MKMVTEASISNITWRSTGIIFRKDNCYYIIIREYDENLLLSVNRQILLEFKNVEIVQTENYFDGCASGFCESSTNTINYYI